MSTVRLRRLTADQASLEEYVRLHPRVKLVNSEGDPPERYQLEYNIRSLRQSGEELLVNKTHLVEITLPRNYPRTPPQCRMLSPVFHPNIAPHAICVGDHWSAGESLKSIVIRIGEMLAYQSYNVKSPLNGEAARWVEQNQDRLPLDDVSLLPEERPGGDSRSAVSDNDVPSRPVKRSAPARETAESTISGVRRESSSTDTASDNSGEGTRTTSRASARDPNAEEVQGESTRSTTGMGTGTGAAQIRMEITCPSCGASYKVPIEYRGKKVRCQGCQETFRVG